MTYFRWLKQLNEAKDREKILKNELNTLKEDERTNRLAIQQRMHLKDQNIEKLQKEKNDTMNSNNLLKNEIQLFKTINNELIVKNDITAKNMSIFSDNSKMNENLLLKKIAMLENSMETLGEVREENRKLEEKMELLNMSIRELQVDVYVRFLFFCCCLFLVFVTS